MVIDANLNINVEFAAGMDMMHTFVAKVVTTEVLTEILIANMTNVMRIGDTTTMVMVKDQTRLWQ